MEEEKKKKKNVFGMAFVFHNIHRLMLLKVYHGGTLTKGRSTWIWKKTNNHVSLVCESLGCAVVHGILLVDRDIEDLSKKLNTFPPIFCQFKWLFWGRRRSGKNSSDVFPSSMLAVTLHLRHFGKEITQKN